MSIVLIGLDTIQTSQAPWFKCVSHYVLQNGKLYLLGHLQNTYVPSTYYQLHVLMHNLKYSWLLKYIHYNMYLCIFPIYTSSTIKYTHSFLSFVIDLTPRLLKLDYQDVIITLWLV